MSWLDRLPLGLSPADAIVAMAAVAAMMAVAALWLALVPRGFGAARARELVNRRAALKAAALAPRKRRRVRSQDLMRRVVDRLALLRGRRTESLGHRLARAGYRSQEAAVAFLFAKAALPVAVGGAAALLVMVLGYGELSGQLRLAVVAGAAALGWLIPDIFIANQTERRQHQLRRALPDALDLMVICAEAGLSLDTALQRVGREFDRPNPQLAEEFALAAVEIGFLPDRRKALENLAARTGLSGIQALVSALVQTDRFGTPLAQSLRVLAAEQRTERMLRAEEKAARLPAIMTVPLVLFILPPLFVVLLGPAILSIIDNFVNR